MPMHDWTRVEPTIFHHFHQQWSAGIADALNASLSKTRYSALLEEHIEERDATLRRANRVTIRHRLGEVVCVIEIVSPGNKANRTALAQFLDKTMEFFRAGVSVLLIDPFPPTPRDPHSLHKLIWDQIEEVPFEVPANEPLLLASYRAGEDMTGRLPAAFVETVGVGGALPDMAAWLDYDSCVAVPLERTYQTAWNDSAADFRYLVEHGRLPDE